MTLMSLGQWRFGVADGRTSRFMALVLPVVSLHWPSPGHFTFACYACVDLHKLPQMQVHWHRANGLRQWLGSAGTTCPRISAWRWKWFSWVLIWKLSYVLWNLLPPGLLTRIDLSSQAEFPLLVTGAWSQLIKNHHFNPQSEVLQCIGMEY